MSRLYTTTGRGHRSSIAPYARSFTTAANLAAIRQLETVGALTPAMADDARARIKEQSQ